MLGLMGKNFFDPTVKSDSSKYDNIRKIATGQGDDYTKGCLLDCLYFKKYFKIIDLSTRWCPQNNTRN